jgi:FkbM family methyltransferase
MNLENFDWGWMDESELGHFHKNHIIKETFEQKIYEKFFGVSRGDIVLDIGASVGSFTYSILNKNPKHVYAIEPSETEFPTLVKNTLGYPVTHILKGISDENSYVKGDGVYGTNLMIDGITFEKLIKLYNLEKIDFLKTDCEGGEYHIFTENNLAFLKNNVSKIVGEWHLKTPELQDKFRYFRDNILIHFPNFEIYSLDEFDIKWELHTERFIEWYDEIIIYIKNN